MEAVTTYKPVGRCIYCGRLPSKSDPLSREHIIPEALGGCHVLPKASCSLCRDITSKIELVVLRKMLGPTRAALNLRSTRRRDQPRPRFKVNVKSGIKDAEGNEAPAETREVEILPLIPGVLFDEPGVLRNAGPKDPARIVALGGWVPPVPVEDAVRGLPHQVSVELNHSMFFRMIAKIAHGFAVAAYGVDGFTPLLAETIRRGGGIESYYVGGLGIGSKLEATSSLHEVTSRTIVKDGKAFLVATVSLFARIGYPPHQAVFGERK